MNKGNVADTEVEKINNALKITQAHSPYSRLHWRYGSFTDNIRYLVPDRIKMSVSEAVKINTKAMERFHEMVDYNPAEKTYTKEEII
jgi:hypothetical protein